MSGDWTPHLLDSLVSAEYYNHIQFFSKNYILHFVLGPPFTLHCLNVNTKQFFLHTTLILIYKIYSRHIN